MPLKPSTVRGCPTRVNLYGYNYQAAGLQVIEIDYPANLDLSGCFCLITNFGDSHQPKG